MKSTENPVGDESLVVESSRGLSYLIVNGLGEIGSAASVQLVTTQTESAVNRPPFAGQPAGARTGLMDAFRQPQ